MRILTTTTTALLLCLSATTAAWALTPTETVRSRVDEALQSLGRAGAAEARRAEIRRVADSLFDFTEMSRRALGRHWADRTAGERDEFVQIVMQTGFAGPKPPRTLLAELDIQGYHNKADGPDALLMWVDVGLKAHKLLSRLRERERMHSDLVANVSHEFRTPLNIIAGYAEMLLDQGCGHLPDAAGETVKAIVDSHSTR